MNLSGKSLRLALLLLAGFYFGSPPSAMAQDDAPDEFTVDLPNGERRLDGKVRSINADRGTFVLNATSVSYPSGKPKAFDAPVAMVVAATNNTFFHVRGKSVPGAGLETVHIGDSAVVIATFSEASQRWSATEVALWNKKDQTGYTLDGFVPQPVQPAPPTPVLQPGQTAPETAPPLPAPIPPGLVTIWSGDNTNGDFTHTHAGLLQNGTTYEPGVVGSAFSFDGQDDRFSVPDSPAFELTKSFSVECWILVKSVDNDAIFFIRGDNRGGLDPYALTITTEGHVHFHIGGETEDADSDTPIPIGSWVHIAATLDDATSAMRIYVDGELSSEIRTNVRPLRQLFANQGAGLGLGNAPAMPVPAVNMPFHGLIDEFSIYSRALTPKEIKAIFLAGSAGKATIVPIQKPPLPLPTHPSDTAQPTAPAATIPATATPAQ